MDGWILLEIAVNLFRAWLIVYALKKLLVPAWGNVWTDCACIAAIAGWYTMYLFWDVPILDSAVFVFPFLYASLARRVKWYLCLFWNVVLCIVFTACTTLNISFYLDALGAKLEEIMTASPLRVAFLVSVNLTLLIAVLLIAELCNRSKAPARSTLAPLFALNLMSLLAVEFLFATRTNVDPGAPFAFACLCLFFVSALSVVLYEACTRIAQKQKQYELEIDRLNMTQKHNRETESLYADMAACRHDMKHQIQIVMQILSDRDTGNFQHYIDELHTHVQALQPFATGNQAVDALLTAKVSIMRHEQIELDFRPYPLDILPIPESDFCSVLGNLLDNAAEGIHRIADRSISRKVTLSFARTWDMFYITCTNPCNLATVRRTRGSLVTSKKGAQHGIGTRSIKSIAEKANGDVDFDASGDVFKVKITLPFQAKGA
ncbi:MAG: GHKL domain-containing protein [Christensenellaceae bacterium]|nr:GHKL domain-containing protein [Christensenellaceae bacterium]